MNEKEIKTSAMDKLFQGLQKTSPSSGRTPRESNDDGLSRQIASRRKANADLKEHITTVLPKDLMKKVRLIADIEKINIKDIIEIGLVRIVSDYEKKYGQLPEASDKPGRGDPHSIFG